MGEITQQARVELRKLPLMLGKLLGGIVAVIGFTATVVTVTRMPGFGAADILPTLFTGGAGIAVFLISAKALARRDSQQAAGAIPCDRSDRTNLLSWALLLLFAGIFLACVWFVTG